MIDITVDWTKNEKRNQSSDAMKRVFLKSMKSTTTHLHMYYIFPVEYLTPHEMTASTLSKLKSRMSDRHEK